VFDIKLKRKLPPGNYLVINRPNIAYLTGMDLEGFWLLMTKKEDVIFASSLLAGQLRHELKGFKIIESGMYIHSLKTYCKSKGIKMLKIEGSSLSVNTAKLLGRFVKLADMKDSITKIREIKSEYEIERIKKSCAIAVSAMKYAEKLIKPDITEDEIVFKIEEYFAKHRARPSFPLIIASGPNSANPHHVSSSRKIKHNDVVLVDIGCVYKGYCSDLTRTFFLGKTNSLQKKVYSVVKQAHLSAVCEVKAGARARNVDKTARDKIRKAGFGDKFIHSTGHGVGMEIHEAPRLSAKDKSVLKIGMVVTVEPGIYLEGNFGVRIEDTLAVTMKGRKVLTK
jgi:Xaa-Pro aminopeptidase